VADEGRRNPICRFAYHSKVRLSWRCLWLPPLDRPHRSSRPMIPESTQTAVSKVRDANQQQEYAIRGCFAPRRSLHWRRKNACYAQWHRPEGGRRRSVRRAQRVISLPCRDAREDGPLPLIGALLERRSRRFGQGMSLNGGLLPTTAPLLRSL